MILTCLLLHVGICQATRYQITGHEARVPLRLSGKMILLPGQVDGIAGFFLLDTGAPELILNRRYFPDYNPTDSRTLHTIGHSNVICRIYIDSFSVGKLYRYRFQVPVMDMTPTEKLLGAPLLGLLGYEVIRNFELRIDYYGLQVSLCRLDEQGEPLRAWQARGPDHSLYFSMSGHLPILKTTLSGGRRLYLGLDSGSSVNIVHHRVRRTVRELAFDRRSITYQCIGIKERNAPLYTLPYLDIQAAYRIHYWRTTIEDLSGFRQQGINIDGILGANFFRMGRVSLNYRKKYIRIWDDPERTNQRYICISHSAGEE